MNNEFGCVRTEKLDKDGHLTIDGYNATARRTLKCPAHP